MESSSTRRIFSTSYRQGLRRFIKLREQKHTRKGTSFCILLMVRLPQIFSSMKICVAQTNETMISSSTPSHRRMKPTSSSGHSLPIRIPGRKLSGDGHTKKRLEPTGYIKRIDAIYGSGGMSYGIVPAWRRLASFRNRGRTDPAQARRCWRSKRPSDNEHTCRIRGRRGNRSLGAVVLDGGAGEITARYNGKEERLPDRGLPGRRHRSLNMPSLVRFKRLERC